MRQIQSITQLQKPQGYDVVPGKQSVTTKQQHTFHFARNTLGLFGGPWMVKIYIYTASTVHSNEALEDMRCVLGSRSCSAKAINRLHSCKFLRDIVKVYM